MSRRAQFRPLFESGNTIGTVLLVALVDELGTEFFSWEPESLRMEIHDRFDAETPPENMDKIQALVMALTTNQFYVSLEAFIHTANALAGEGSDFDTFDPADIDEIAWAVAEVLTLDPPEDGDSSKLFSQEIRSYIAEKAKDEGFTRLPRPLNKLAGDLLEHKPIGDFAPDTDADLAAASIQSETDDIDRIEQYVKGRLQTSMDGINSLRLQRGDVETWTDYSKRTPTWGAPQKRDLLANILD